MSITFHRNYIRLSEMLWQCVDYHSTFNRAQLLSTAVIQVFLATALYQLYRLLIYVGRKKITKTPSLMLRVGPCCCWPCLPFPSLEMTDANLSWLRILALQLPIVQVRSLPFSRVSSRSDYLPSSSLSLTPNNNYFPDRLQTIELSGDYLNLDKCNIWPK